MSKVYKSLAELKTDFRNMRSGIHTHYCNKCQRDKYCAQVTHCRKGEESVCWECEVQAEKVTKG